MNVYLKIRIRDFFISSLLSASNIFLAFFSCVSDILLPRSINIIELILIIPNPPACINSNKTSCPAPVSLSLTLITESPVTQTALTAVNIASINDTPCGEQNGKYNIMPPVRQSRKKVAGSILSGVFVINSNLFFRFAIKFIIHF